MKGKFIVLEGVEGAGKSTQAKLLCDALNLRGVRCIVTREPGGTLLAENMRNLILDPNYDPDALTELYMYSAARRDHLNKIVFPAMENGAVVVCDRFIYSTLAYQGYGRELDLNFVRDVNARTVSPLKIDLAVFLDIPPERGFTRKGGADKSDRMESQKMEFFDRVYKGFTDMVKAGELVAVDASGGERETAEKILELTERVL